MYKHRSSGSPVKRGDREVAERIFLKIMANNFPNVMENINLYTQEAQWLTTRINLAQISRYLIG